ncbi:hypothetical protein CSE45_3932 [Citreicella sp. SE45]|nr:hypothetical protein CSE45_3932 [Citreicella sp. SE45]
MGEAIDKARLIWAKDYQAELPREVIADHMGYGSLNGKSLGLIAAVSRYGLLEGRGDKTKVTDLAVRILAHEPGDRERIDAISEAARSPSLFRDIGEKFEGRSPSDQALKSYLLTRGFTLSGADGVLRSFRETEEFVKIETASYDSPYADEVKEETVSVTHAAVPEAPAVPPPAPQPGVPTISMSDNGLEISGGTITTMEQFKRLMRRLNAGMVLLDEDDDDESDLI